MQKGMTFLQECALRAKRFEVSGGEIKEVEPAKSRGKPNPAYRTPPDGTLVGGVLTKAESRQTRWRKKNKAKVAAYMRDYRAKQNLA